ncbi:MAG: energy transducer TonB [Bacteroidales bacterium]|nr:energy transducer TonB [Bacteroidales bacterium]
MEIKKSEKANLENRRLLFTEIGFFIALLIVFGAFEYTSRDKKESTMQAEAVAIEEEEMIPITQETPPPPPEVPDIPLLSDQIDIVDDNIKVDDNILNLEDDANLGVDLKDYIAGDVDDEEVEEADVPFAIVEEKPKFMGKDPTVAFSKWVGEHLNYPETARENGVQGRVILQFTVGKDGQIGKIKVLRGVDPLLDKEAVRVVGTSPKWTPGKQRDRAVPVTYTFPVIFQLR